MLLRYYSAFENCGRSVCTRKLRWTRTGDEEILTYMRLLGAVNIFSIFGFLRQLLSDNYSQLSLSLSTTPTAGLLLDPMGRVQYGGQNHHAFNCSRSQGN